MPTLTIFTPAYNRANTLPRTYASLCGQGCRDFLWLIVDDGSTDQTARLVRGWQAENPGFEIRYVYKENGGMHTAHNTAYAHIDTELNMCIDSDDCLAQDAVEKLLTKWRQVRELGYAGMIGLDADMEGKRIGKGFPEGMTDTTLTEYYAGGGFGDKKLVYRTDVVRQYPPYPVFPGEKYVALAYKYRLIDRDYRLAVLDEVLCNVEYQSDGSTGTMWRAYLHNPRGFAFWRRFCMEQPLPPGRRVVECVHYCSSSLLAGDRRYLADSPRKLLTALCTPAGWALSVLVRWRGGK